MTIHKVHIDTHSFNCKPDSAEIKRINLRIVDEPRKVSIDELAKEITQPSGKTYIPAYLEGKRRNDCWKSQSIFALDFDDDLSFNALHNRAGDYNILPAFVYHTFSHSAEKEKFRAIWQLSEPITDSSIRARIMNALLFIFPEADKACKDGSRIFFGGLDLIYTNYDTFLDLDTLYDIATFHNSRSSSSKNHSRNIRRTEKKLRLSENGSKIHTAYIKNIETEQNASKFEKPEIVRGVEFHKLRKKIKILDDFLNSEEKLKHPQLLGLATNLRWIEGGQSLFRNCIESNPEYAEEKLNIMNYCKHKNYAPMRLENFSPYEEDHKFLNLLQAGRKKSIIRLKPLQGITLEQAREKLEQVFRSVLASDNTKVHVIKIPTGLGKTRLCENLDNVVIAFPNHSLKEEVSSRMMTEHKLTPDIKNLPIQIQNHLEHYFSIGAIAEANQYLQTISEDNEDVKNYLNECQECYESTQTVLTTHHKGIFASWQHDTLIFDEDITQILLNVNKVSVNDLIRLKSLDIDEQYIQAIQKVINNIQSDKNIYAYETSLTFRRNYRLCDAILKSSIKFETNILHFFSSSYYVRDTQDPALIHYINSPTLPVTKKVIILSATADKNIYEKLFGDRLCFHDMGYVESAGIIEQDYTYSLSRNSLSKHLDFAKERVGDLPVITFASFKQNFSNPVKEMHFGKTTGFDTLKGQRIAVVGTPHMSLSVLKLYAKALGINIQENSFAIHQQLVEHNGFRFWFNAYNNLELQKLQFFFIESELRQAVGRARVNTEPEAYVLLLSSYPLPEAQIVS